MKQLKIRSDSDFITALQINDRVYYVNTCPRRCNLMLLKYDKGRFFTQDVLACLGSQTVNAGLVAPALIDDTQS